MASKLLGSFSIREKGVGGLRQFDGGHKIKSRLNFSCFRSCSYFAVLKIGYCDKKCEFQPCASSFKKVLFNFFLEERHHQIAGNPL